ncbi:hypothetical protein ACFL0L_03235 [Patescibacteria group bacterium]
MPASKKVRASCKSTIVGVFCVLAGLGGLVFGSYAYIAQAQWIEPHSDPITWVKDPNIDAPLYAGDGLNYAQSAQAREGALTIGSPGYTGTKQLNIEGEEAISESLQVGPPRILVGSSPSAAVIAYATNRHGIYGKTTDASMAGILGSNVAAGGSSISGDASAIDGAVGIYGVATGNNSYAIYGSNSGSGWAGYFEGNLEIAGGNFTLTDAIFTGDVDMLSNLCSAVNPCDVNGFHIDTVNALSVQDQIFGDPLNSPGIKMFELSSLDDLCTLSDEVTPCPSDGMIPIGETAVWDVGATGLLDSKAVVVAYIPEYSDDEGGTFYPVGSADIVYEECDVAGSAAAGIFRANNPSFSSSYQFRLTAYYKQFPADQTCIPSFPSRQITVPDSDQYDTVQLSITGADAASIFNQSLPSGDDVYVTYMGADIDRDVVTFTNTDIEIWFQVQATTAGDNTSYLLTYADPARQSAPSDKEGVYYLWDDFTGVNGDPPDATKWGISDSHLAGSCGTGGSSAHIQNNELWLEHITPVACWTGASAFTASEFNTSGNYTIQFQVDIETYDGWVGADGLYIRNPSSFRNTQHYDGPNEKAIYVGLGNSCTSAGIWVFAHGDRPDTSFHCFWDTDGRVAQYDVTYGKGIFRNFEIELNADTRDIKVYEGGIERASGNVPVDKFATIGPTFVVDVNDGVYKNSGSGQEKYDNFYIRRGKNDFDPQATVGPEL